MLIGWSSYLLVAIGIFLLERVRRGLDALTEAAKERIIAAHRAIDSIFFILMTSCKRK